MDRELTPQEVAAMWLYGADYARRGLSAIDFWKRLDPRRRQTVEDFVAQMSVAFAHDREV